MAVAWTWGRLLITAQHTANPIYTLCVTHYTLHATHRVCKSVCKWDIYSDWSDKSCQLPTAHTVLYQ